MTGYPSFRETVSRQAQQAAEDVFGESLTCFLGGNTDNIRDVRARIHTKSVQPKLEDSDGTAVFMEIEPRLIFCVTDKNSYVPQAGDIYALSKTEMYKAVTPETREGVYAPVCCARLTQDAAMKKYLPFLG